jgi:hypothetical protein
MRLVYLSPVAWGYHAHRPHRLVEWFHRETAGEVLWVNPYPTRLPSWNDLRRCLNTVSNTNSTKPHWLTILSPRALPMEPLPGLGRLNRLLWGDMIKTIKHFVAGDPCILGIGKPSRLALHLIDTIQVDLSFFDAMDDFPAFYSGLSRKALQARELAIASRVSVLIVSSTALMRRWSGYRNNAVLALNGCDANALAPAEACKRLFDNNVMGYIGTIGEWFDWEIVFRLAQAKPMMKIHVIGPAVERLPDNMPTNIKILGPCRNDEAIAAMEKFCIGLIPFKQSRLTASVDPIKYYEYRAIGLPVVSTRFGEMALRENEPGVFLVDRRTDLLSAVDAASAYRMSTPEIERFRANNSWHTRFSSAGILS